jgi:hypothetical protein
MFDVFLEGSRHGFFLGFMLSKTARFLNQFVVDRQVRSHV